MAGEIRDKVTSGGTTQPGYEDESATDSAKGNDAVQGQLSTALSGDNAEKSDDFGVSSTAERNADRKHVDDGETSVFGHTSGVLTSAEESQSTDGEDQAKPSGAATASIELQDSMKYNDSSLDY